jgi:hypothetical protein
MSARYIRTLFSLCICVAVSYTASAQDASRIYVEPDGWAIGTNFGTTDLWGDVGTKSPITHYSNSKYFDKVVFMGGLFGRYSIHPCLSVRLGFSYGTLYATDKWNYDAVKGTTVATQGEDAFQRYERNQDAKDNIFESNVLFEFMPFRMNPESHSASRRGQLFLGAGFAMFHFTPYSTVANSNQWVNTYDLDLEGQGFGAGYPKQYHLWQPAIPLAIGYRWDIGEHVNLGIEYMWRYTFTDYLDGVSGKYIAASAYGEHMSAKNAILAEEVADKSQYSGLSSFPNAAGNLRGNPSNKDSYSSISITISYKVLTRTKKWW